MQQRRMGEPRTNAERKKRHQQKYGTSKLPPRGTGLSQNEGMYKHTLCQTLY